MNLQDKDWIQELAKRLAATDIDSLELAGPALTLRLTRAPGGAVKPQVLPTTQNATAVIDADDASLTLRAGSVGVVRLAHPLRGEPLAPAGELVTAGQTLLLLQVGQVLLPVNAPRPGRVRQVLVASGEAIGYGHPLVQIEPH
ncbi:MAG: acetyl-CoA carboxylase [Rhodoferax sp.]|nr:acetyl-CoA carboxylase [Rhodoferax sp.]